MQQLQQQKIKDSAFAPSFNCYSCDSTTSTAITKVIREEEEIAPFHHESDDFEFSLSDEDASDLTVFPVFNRHDLLVNDDQIDASSAITDPLGKLFIGDSEESSSCSSSEADESEIPRKCKKSGSTGSVSKRWILFRYFLRRSNSEGKEPKVMFTPKKADSPKHKRNSGENSKFDGRWKAKSPVHEQFYGRKREEEKWRKTYLPYRKDLVGLFANVNGMGKKMLPF